MIRTNDGLILSSSTPERIVVELREASYEPERSLRAFMEATARRIAVQRRMREMTLYWAYGSNLNKAHMARRCPAARPVAPLTVPGKVLRFRHVADVVRSTRGSCPGAVWEITDECEKSLDVYEGVSGGLYVKRYFPVDRGRGREQCLYYKMQRDGIMPPSQGYLDIIAQGYEDWGLPTEALDRAVQHSWGNKDKTPYLRHRYARSGRPYLADPPTLLGRVRRQLSLSAKGMGRLFNVNERTIRRWERDDTTLPASIRHSLEQFEEVDISAQIG
jgi:hypothetical protein